MKKILLPALVFLCVNPIGLKAQKKSKNHGIYSFNVSMSDYIFPKTVEDSSISKALQQKDWLKPANKSFGIGVSYWKGLTPHIDFSGTFTGTLASFPANFVKGDSVGQATFCSQLDALLHFKLLKDGAIVNPFLTAGIGAGSFPKQFAAYAPLGTGLQFHFNDGAKIIVQAQWRKAITSGIKNDYVQYSIGFAQSAKIRIPSAKPAEKKSKKEKKEKKKRETKEKKAIKVTQEDKLKPVLPVVVDTDGDGVPDAKDSCPTVKGTLNGCPDTDGDGIADKDDKCPAVPGVARYSGCPVPDTDNDGINDEEDRCPKVPGTKELHGCPPPVEAVTSTDTTVKVIYFEPGKSILHSDGYATLAEVVKLLKQNKNLVAVCSGHTDNTGSVEANNSRSLSRAQVCADYITSFYISKERITVKAMGNTMPAADLNDPLLQWKNRRVEILVFEKR